ncbi:MAG TPA: SPOR domain-containing protein [Candidatus Limnocylindria bacterium]|nr:SPOR domain-containing protein [Candidatus Limnocylindria bacterium]
MSPDRDDRNNALEPDTYEEEPPRSIFAATWFRAVLILIVLGVIGAIAVPYILNAVNPPASQQAAVRTTPLPVAPPAPTASSAPAPPMTPPPTAAPAAPSPTPPRATPAPTAVKPPAPVAKAELPAAKPATPAPRAAAPPKSSTPAKPPASAPARTTAAAPRQARAAGTTPAPAGPYWVQVGAFKNEETAKRLAAGLRAQNFKVADVVGTPAAPAAAPAAAPVPAGADQYDVFVTGLPPAELTTRLVAKGLAAETSGAGVVIRPSLPLRDAVALSKDLAVEGLKVQVRRAGGGDTARPSTRPPAPAVASATAGDGLYRVRVGAFTERTAAVAALRELEAKGYKPFIARGER